MKETRRVLTPGRKMGGASLLFRLQLLVLFFCCLVLSLHTVKAADESSGKINWSDYEGEIEKAGWDGDFMTVPDTGLKMWVPDALKATSLSEADKENGYVLFLQTADESSYTSVQTADGVTVDDYSASLTEHGAENVVSGTINDLKAVSFELPENDILGAAVETEDGKFVLFMFGPASDESYAAVVSVMEASIQTYEADENETAEAKKGTNFTVNGRKYKITKTGRGRSVSMTKIKGSGKVTVPKKVTYNGYTYSVTSIGAKAAYGNKKITSVTIASSVISIGSKAFGSCTALKSVTIGKNVKTIGKQAFYGCKKLKTITVKSKKLKASGIGSKAFSKTYGKPVLKVPKSCAAAYKKLFVAKGLNKKVTIKKS